MPHPLFGKDILQSARLAYLLIRVLGDSMATMVESHFFHLARVLVLSHNRIHLEQTAARLRLGMITPSSRLVEEVTVRHLVSKPHDQVQARHKAMLVMPLQLRPLALLVETQWHSGLRPAHLQLREGQHYSQPRQHPRSSQRRRRRHQHQNQHPHSHRNQAEGHLHLRKWVYLRAKKERIA